jgi:hypothetical protein
MTTGAGDVTRWMITGSACVVVVVVVICGLGVELPTWDNVNKQTPYTGKYPQIHGTAQTVSFSSETAE